MTFINIINLLTKREKIISLCLILMTIIMALLDMIGVASIMPFVYVLADPSKIQNNPFLKYGYDLVDFRNENQYLIFLGLIFFTFIILSLVFKAITSFFQYRFIITREYSIGKRLFSKYINQPYDVFLNKNSNEYINNILSEVNQVILQAFIPFMNLIANIFVSIALFSLILFVDIKLSMIIIFALGGSYLMVFYFVNNFLEEIGRQKLSANKERFKIINESFGGIKEIKLNNLESHFLNKFAKYAKIFAFNQSISAVIALLPRFILEALTFGGMLSIVLYLFSINSDINTSLPTIALFALAGYKLIPALQQIYASLSSLKFCKTSVNNLMNELKIDNPIIKCSKSNFADFHFENKISLRKVNFQYPGSKQITLKNISLDIKKNTISAFVGSTGGGKTTIIDLIIGLLSPDEGELIVDNTIIDENNISSWQELIGYVPQNIFLADASISSNIAFGQKKYDFEKIIKVSKIACIDKFIENNLPLKYDTMVGDKGVKLSGGQKQRIGLARALYKSPKVLILDEATSALDNITERKVMESILELSSEITILIIAHRLSTIVNSNNIFLIDKGSIIDKGTFEHLQKNKIFKDMSINF